MAPFDGTTRQRLAAVLRSRFRTLAIEDPPAGLTTGDACRPTPLSLLTPDSGTGEIAMRGWLTGQGHNWGRSSIPETRREGSFRL
jgi:hypothetical protein